VNTLHCKYCGSDKHLDGADYCNKCGKTLRNE